MSTPESRREKFDGLDDNKDGFLTLEEYYDGSTAVEPSRQQEHIDSLDVDRNGKLDFDEFSSYQQKQRC